MIVLASGACASKDYVRRQMDPERGFEKERLTELERRLVEPDGTEPEHDRRVSLIVAS